MERFNKVIIILVIVLVYILGWSYQLNENMDNTHLNPNKQLIVISDGNFTQIAKYFNQKEFQLINLSNWKKFPKPFDVFIGISSINIGSIEKELGLVSKMCEKAKPYGKIIQIINENQTKISQHILIKHIEDLACKYYGESIGVCTINLDATIDANTIDFILTNPWNVLTGRAFSSKLIGIKSRGYLLGISIEYTRVNLLINQVSKKKFNGESVITPNIEQKELSVYSNSSGALAKRLGEIHGVDTNGIEFHNGIMGFLQLMIPVFVPEAHEIICWQMSYLTRIVKSVNIIHAESIIQKFIAIPNYKEILSKLSSKTRLIYLSGPIEKAPFDKFIKSVPKNIIVIVDFCYNGFVNDKSNLNIQMQDCAKYESYVLGLNTLSKANGLAGVHLSYSIGHESIQTIISNYFHYPVNLFYEKLALKALESTYTTKVNDFYSREKIKLSKQLADKNIPYWFELAITLVIDLEKLPKDKILSNINKLGLENYWKFYGNYLKIFLSTEKVNAQLASAIIN